MNFYLVILISVAVGITCVAGDSFTKVQDKLKKELSDMRYTINFDYSHFMKDDKDAKVETTVQNSLSCAKAIGSIHVLVFHYKTPLDIKEEVLATKAKEAYDKCTNLMAALSSLEIGKQIIETNKNTFTSSLQLVLDKLKGIVAMHSFVEKIHEFSSNLVADLSKTEIGKNLTKEKKEAFVKAFTQLLDNLKDADLENGEDLPIVKTIKELKKCKSK